MALEWLRKTREDGQVDTCCPECDSAVDSKLTYCTECGYDIVKEAKIDLTHPPRIN